MKKYDCTKSLDYSHELKRLCTYGEPNFGCVNFECPLRDKGCFLITAETVALLQEWSDEHPEPKLTREEYAFLQAFRLTVDKHIKREAGSVRLMVINTTPRLRPSMFRFIREGEAWSMGDLLQLEVEE